MAIKSNYGKYTGDIRIELPEVFEAEAIALEKEDFDSAWESIRNYLNKDFFEFKVKDDENNDGYTASLMYTGNDKHRLGLTMRGGGDTWKLAVCVLVLKLDICPPERWEKDLATKAKRLRGIR